jgi:hypothetical protein
MHLVIKNPAETGPALLRSGDYHFGASLARALTALGVSVTEQFWPDWGAVAGADAVLVLRGKHVYRPPPGELAALWVISHPASVSVAEIDAFAIAWLGGETHLKMIADAARTPLGVLRQCSDFELTAGPAATEDESARRGALFVGNSRGVFRDTRRLAAKVAADHSFAARVRQIIDGLSALPKPTLARTISLVATSASIPAGGSDRFGVVGRALAAVSSTRQRKTRPEILHVHPTAEGVAAFGAVSAKALTAGLGLGPLGGRARRRHHPDRAPPIRCDLCRSAAAGRRKAAHEAGNHRAALRAGEARQRHHSSQ